MSLQKPMISSRIDRVTLIPESHRKTICPVPRSVKIELTSRCDLRCKFCATSKGLREKGDMDLDLYKRIVSEMAYEGVKEIGVFYLGESALYPYLAEAIAHANMEGIEYVFLTTNGRMLNQNLLYNMFESGLDSLKFSFNSYDATQYKEVTGVDGFDKVVANIRLAREVRDDVYARTGHYCGLYASSIQFDGEQMRLMEESSKENVIPFVNEHYWLPLYNQAGFTQGAMGKRSVAGNIGRVGALRDPLPCWALFTEGHVTWDGILTGCCFSHDGSWDFGDLKTMPFMKAWNSKSAQNLRQANLNKDVTGTACEKCIAYA